MDNEEKKAIHGDWPRSYLRRQGKVTRAQKRALRELWEDFGVDCPHGTAHDLDTIFGREAPRTLAIGFGMGENILAMASAHPERDYFGVEVHLPGLGMVLNEIDARGLTNLRVARRDVIKLLKDHLVTPPAFDEVFLFFPEPWPKDKDRGRRLVRPLLLELLERRMTPGGVIHLATDVEQYAEHVVSVFAKDPRWTSEAEPGQDYVTRPAWRPMTKYEQKGLDEGRSIFDLRYRAPEK